MTTTSQAAPVPAPVTTPPGRGPAGPVPAPPGGGRRRGGWLPYALVAPSVLALLVLLGWPVVRDVAISFQRLGLAELVQRRTVWIGLENYREVLTDPFFWTVVVRTVLFTVVNVALTMALGLAVALLLAAVSRGVQIGLSVALVLAWAVPPISATVIFQWLFDTQFGIVNQVLTGLGLDFADHSWFATGVSTFGVITALVVWQAIPLVALSLFASMTSVSTELYEAAAMDGAGPWRRFTAVTWPAVRPMALVLTFLSVIWDFKVFTQVYGIRQGGPNRETVTMALYAYQKGIGSREFGTAAAISVIMMLMLTAGLAWYARMMVRSAEEEQ
ncbi:carbohydrate ABC transporter permease [Pseudonocardia humida]|uniref:Sugar ABC transporter permease n=1 Tax=Pseudonocardia humida TaxID=2800819 RepID=A0ABT1A7C1_9PSEU|nr:sugar ABC transporter permease [Pseudonocardia humida]MCO1658624.1 sugar ABC transporter permease [Pseudonocardia humida]